MSGDIRLLFLITHCYFGHVKLTVNLLPLFRCQFSLEFKWFCEKADFLSGSSDVFLDFFHHVLVTEEVEPNGSILFFNFVKDLILIEFFQFWISYFRDSMCFID